MAREDIGKRDVMLQKVNVEKKNSKQYELTPCGQSQYEASLCNFSKHGWTEGFEFEPNSFDGTVELNSSTINLIDRIKITLSSFFPIPRRRNAQATKCFS